MERKTITITKEMDKIVKNGMSEYIVKESKTTSESEIINSMLLGVFFSNLDVEKIEEYQEKMKNEGFELRKTITINKKISKEITQLTGFLGHSKGLKISESRLINILLVFAYEDHVLDDISGQIQKLKTDQFTIPKFDFKNIPAMDYQTNQEVKKYNIIPNEEDEKNEFKSTFQYDMKEEDLRKNGKLDEAEQRKQNQKHIKKSIQKEIALTIAAFANSEGGKLFVGISDKGEVLGIGRDLKNFDNSIDKFTLTITDYLKTILKNITFVASLQFEFNDKDDKKYLQINIPKSNEPIFVNYEGSQETYVRMQKNSEKLDPQEFFKYSMNHFSKN